MPQLVLHALAVPPRDLCVLQHAPHLVDRPAQLLARAHIVHLRALLPEPLQLPHPRIHPQPQPHPRVHPHPAPQRGRRALVLPARAGPPRPHPPRGPLHEPAAARHDRVDDRRMRRSDDVAPEVRELPRDRQRRARRLAKERPALRVQRPVRLRVQRRAVCGERHLSLSLSVCVYLYACLAGLGGVCARSCVSVSSRPIGSVRASVVRGPHG
ncbi:hypothetical protein BV25DRAFT_199349 [Artomyces pyxidatus]|uniref:Uncharacterized protein n=1 Tax=Artomyces pyxidatus TaxID=48021 RepID=A0ACB8T7X8_9AGAM|nr:hypothetical protein BV25DRAFT_199349 [Artomyces pyxidatus]